MDEPTSEGKTKIERWREALKAVERAKEGLNRAEVELSNATSDLNKWLRPADAKEDEVICVWWGDSLIQSARVRGFDQITVRKRGKSLLG